MTVMQHDTSTAAAAVLSMIGPYEDGLSQIFETHFGERLLDKREVLSVLAAKQLAAHAGLSFDARQVDEGAAAALDEADQWIARKRLSDRKRALLNIVAHGTLLSIFVEHELSLGSLIGAIDHLTKLGHCHGLAIGVAAEISKRSQGGREGAKVRQKAIDAMVEKSLEIYRSVTTGKESASSAAEKARDKGAPLSHEKLTSIIRLDRKGALATKARI